MLIFYYKLINFIFNILSDTFKGKVHVIGTLLINDSLKWLKCEQDHISDIFDKTVFEQGQCET